VGKSTTAVSLGAALAELGQKVLVIDLDPQGNASTGMGIRHEAREVTVYEVLSSEGDIDRAIVPTVVDGLDAVPSTIDLAGAEIELVSQFSRELRLRKALEPLREDHYDFVFLDCPPSLGLLTVNALAAAEELIVPIQCEYYALEGLGQLLRNVRLVQQNVNPRLRLTGIVLTMFDPRTKLSEQVVEEVRRYVGERVYDVVIPRTVRLSEAPGYGLPITHYDPRSRGAECYRELAREVVERPPMDDPLPALADLPHVTPDMGRGAPAHPPRSAPVPVTTPGEGSGRPEAEGRPQAEAGDEPKPGAAVARTSRASKGEGGGEPASGSGPEPGDAGPAEDAPPGVDASGTRASLGGRDERRRATSTEARPEARGPRETTGSSDARTEELPAGPDPDAEAELDEDLARAPRSDTPPQQARRRAEPSGERARSSRSTGRAPQVVVIDDLTGLGDERARAEAAATQPPVPAGMEEREMPEFERPKPKRRWRLFRRGGEG
jgi:chromosome partitioning protein